MQITWGELDAQVYETGIDRGVLYVDGLDGVAWNGLINVTESPSGGEARPFYIDGVKYLNLASTEEFAGSITAFYSPEEFDLCDGSIALVSGVLTHQQVRRPFCFSFRTKIGNPVEGIDFGYKIHIVYNAMATPAVRTYKSLSDSTDLVNLSWAITTRSIPFPDLGPTAHIIVDTSKASSGAVTALESVLYGSSLEDARVPFPEEILELFGITTPLIIIDNGDGTYTAIGGTSNVKPSTYLDSFEIISSTIHLIGDEFDVSST